MKNIKLIIISIVLILIRTNDGILSQTISQNFIQIPSAVGKSNLLKFNLHQNPSQILNDQNNSLSITNYPSIFGLDDLLMNNINYIQKIDSSTKSNISISNIGNENFNQFALIGSLATKFKSIKLSASVEFENNRIKNFNNDNYLGINLASIITINENIDFGIALTNINRDYFGQNNANSTNQNPIQILTQNIHQRIIFGTGITLTDKILCDLDIVVNLERNTSLNFGSLYKLYDNFNVGVAFSTNPQIIELRTNYIVSNNFDININFNKRNELGYIFILALNYNWY